ATPTPSSGTVPCVASKNITLDGPSLIFDNLPPMEHGRPSPHIPSPYNHFSFSQGWIYGRSAAVSHRQFPASSGTSMAAYVPSLAGNASSPGSFGMLPDDTPTQLGSHGFRIRSLRFGCNGLDGAGDGDTGDAHGQDQVCRVLMVGRPLDARARPHGVVLNIEPCVLASGCALAAVDLQQLPFPVLRSMEFTASLANRTVGWFIDDIAMEVDAPCQDRDGAGGESGGIAARAPTAGQQGRHGGPVRRSISYEPRI
ncbi:hypothetical protein KEM52_000679, partial [Ascosphaera acerosa]